MKRKEIWNFCHSPKEHILALIQVHQSKFGPLLQSCGDFIQMQNVLYNFSNPLELLIATQLSAQCTDERVNSVTRDLFQKFRSVEDYVTVSQGEFEQDIRSTGFYPIPRLKAPVLEPWG